MSKIYKDYEDEHVAANVIYVAAVPSEQKTISGKGIFYAFASEESCIRNGKTVNAVKIDKDTLLDRVLKGAVICVEAPPHVGYFTPIGAMIRETSNEGSFTEITVLSGALTVHLVSSEAVLDELGNSGTESEPDQLS